MLIRANTDGTYSANWTPGAVGLYTIHVTIDGIEIGKLCALLCRINNLNHRAKYNTTCPDSLEMFLFLLLQMLD